MSTNRSTSGATTAEDISIGNASEVLDALIRHAGDCIHIVDLDGRIVRWNASCAARTWAMRKPCGTLTGD